MFEVLFEVVWLDLCVWEMSKQGQANVLRLSLEQASQACPEPSPKHQRGKKNLHVVNTLLSIDIKMI